MPYKSAEDRRSYQRDRYARKKLAKQKEMETLNKLGQILLSRKLTKDETTIYTILSEKYESEVFRQKKREQKGRFPADDSDISMYDHISRDERIIKSGNGSTQSDIQAKPITDGRGSNAKTVLITDPSPNTPKVRLSSQSKEWWLNPSSGEFEEKPKKEDSGNVVESPWKILSLYER